MTEERRKKCEESMWVGFLNYLEEKGVPRTDLSAPWQSNDDEEWRREELAGNQGRRPASKRTKAW
jgi:hypothetical protein